MATTPTGGGSASPSEDPSSSETDEIIAATLPDGPPTEPVASPPTTSTSPADDPTPDGGTSADSSSRPPRKKARKRLVNVLAVLTCLATLFSVVAVWTHQTLFDTDAWMEIVGPLADDPAITDAVGVALTDQLFQVIDAEAYAKEALPDQAAFLAAPLTNAVQGFVRDGVQQLLQTDQFKQVWDKANRITHDTAVKLLRGEPVAGLTATDGAVTLNLLPMLSRIMTFINERAPRLFGDRPIPEITQEMPVDQARSELSTALGRDLPEGFGVYTVFQSDQLAAAQNLVTLFDRLVYLIIGLTVALFIATLWLATNRRRTLLVLGLGIALSMVIGNALVSALQDQIVGLIGNETRRQAAQTTLAKLVSSLEVVTTTLVWAGLAVVVAAFLAGDSRVAVAVRRGVSSGAQRARATGVAVVGRDGSTGGPALPIVAEHRSAFRAGGVVVTMLWLIVTTITWGKLALILLVFALYQGAITVLGRTPSADAPPTGADAPEGPPLTASSS
jgi:hypothetical protein